MTKDVSGGKDTKVIYKSAKSGKIVSESYAAINGDECYALTVPEDANPEDYEGQQDL